jgi:thiamine monophosphate synthase
VTGFPPATGGITTGNATAFLGAGARTVALGSAFADAPGEQVRALVKHHQQDDA